MFNLKPWDIINLDDEEIEMFELENILSAEKTYIEEVEDHHPVDEDD